MPPAAPSFATDHQRLARAGQRSTASVIRPVNDQKRLAQAASSRPVTPAVAGSKNTFLIRGKDATYLGFSFGDERQLHQVNLYDYLPAGRVPHLGNYVLDLTGILPDAIGIDIGFSAGASMASAMGGINILWHTRGEGGRGWYPELHVYYGYSASFTIGAIFDSVLAPPNAAGAVQLILAWARKYDGQGKSAPAPNYWVANGFNWTGTFWSVGFSVPVPPRFTFVGSYYQSVPFRDENQSPVIKNQTVWAGVSLGIGMSGKLKLKSPFIKLDVTKILNFKKLNLALNQSQTEYGLVYGNGRDYIPQRNNKDITGWHLPVNQNDYPQ